jgi:P27 family predicted phage terminase small subunit
MRTSRILVVLMLLIAPPSARGQQVQKDVSSPPFITGYAADE